MDRVMKKMTAVLLLVVFSVVPSVAQTQEVSDCRKAVRYSGDALLVAMPLATLTSVLVMQDWQGLKQAAFSTAATLGTTYLLKYTVRKERPDGSNSLSFPSGHTSIMFANAAFVQRRYGWKWGAPAYALATYVGWSRTYARKHDWWDVAAGAAIGAGCSYIFTRPFAREHNLSIVPVSNGTHFGLAASFTL